MADEQEPKRRAMAWLPIDVVGAAPENVRPIYSDTTFVSRSADDITIAFFLTKRPPMTDEQLAALKMLPAECVARIILPPRSAAALGELLKRFAEEALKRE